MSGTELAARGAGYVCSISVSGSGRTDPMLAAQASEIRQSDHPSRLAGWPAGVSGREARDGRGSPRDRPVNPRKNPRARRGEGDGRGWGDDAFRGRATQIRSEGGWPGSNFQFTTPEVALGRVLNIISNPKSTSST